MTKEKEKSRTEKEVCVGKDRQPREKRERHGEDRMIGGGGGMQRDTSGQYSFRVGSNEQETCFEEDRGAKLGAVCR